MEYNHHDIHQDDVNVNSITTINHIANGNEGLFLSSSYLGIYLLCLGLWWWIQALRQRYSSSSSSSIKHNDHHHHDNDNDGYHRSTTTIGSWCCQSRLCEGLCKIVCCLIGIVVELITLKLGRDHEYAQFPFYTAMTTVGILDILMSTIMAPPKGLDSIIYALPFFVQTYCLRAQSYQQPHITETCRLLISYWAFIVGSSILNEMIMNENKSSSSSSSSSLLWIWIKCFTVIFHGSWICQTGFLLNSPFNPSWNENDHDKVMYTTIIFVWYMLFVMIAQLVLLLIVAKCYGVSPDWTESIDSSLKRKTSHKYDRQSLNPSNSLNTYDNIEYTKLLNTDYIE